MIEGILPECYFNNNMRGLSIDMAVFRDLLKLRLPRLSKHLDNLQFSETKEGSKGNQNYCIDIRWKKLKNIWLTFMLKDSVGMLLFCRYKFWTSIDKCIYNAVVSDPVFNLPSKRYRITCMGPYPSGRKWNTIENGPCDLERVRGVSRIFHIYIIPWKGNHYQIMSNIDDHIEFYQTGVSFKQRILQMNFIAWWGNCLRKCWNTNFLILTSLLRYVFRYKLILI